MMKRTLNRNALAFAHRSIPFIDEYCNSIFRAMLSHALLQTANIEHNTADFLGHFLKVAEKIFMQRRRAAVCHISKYHIGLSE